MIKLNSNQLVIISSIAFVLLVIILAIIGITRQGNHSSPEPSSAYQNIFLNSSKNTVAKSNEKEQLHIPDIAKTIKNIPTIELKQLDESIIESIKINYTGNTKQLRGKIRKGSYSQTFSQDGKDIYTSRFIVDFADIKQSYDVQHTFSMLPAEMSGLYDYTVLVRCPKPNQLIYGAFPCKDRMSIEKGY